MIGNHATFGDTRRRRRRQLYWRVTRVLLAVMTVAGVGGYAYQIGTSAALARAEKLEADLVRFQESNLDLRDRLTLTAQRSGQAESALDELRRRYAENVPEGAAAELHARLEAQLRAGVEPERLAFLIDAAAEGVGCDGTPVTKRFMPRTAVSAGPMSYVRFGDRVTVTGAGEPMRSAEGLPEAWFDPALPIRLDFRTLDGAVVSIEGVVPLTHSMVIDRREYRFAVIAGEQRFVEITAQDCALPDATDIDAAAGERLGPDDPEGFGADAPAREGLSPDDDAEGLDGDTAARASSGSDDAPEGIDADAAARASSGPDASAEGFDVDADGPRWD